jgi:hypothetical protein
MKTVMHSIVVGILAATALVGTAVIEESIQAFAITPPLPSPISCAGILATVPPGELLYWHSFIGMR